MNCKNINKNISYLYTNDFDKNQVMKFENIKREVETIKNFSEWFEKGLAYLNDNDYPTSIFSFNKCLEMKSDDAEVWYNIAMAYRKLGRSEYAEPCIEQSIALNRKNKNAKKMQEEISSEVFGQTMFGMYETPIDGVNFEGEGIKDRSDALLDVFRPYLMLNNSKINILGIESQNQGTDLRNKIRIQLSGALRGMGSMRLQADIQNSFEKLDHSIQLVWVETHYI